MSSVALTTIRPAAAAVVVVAIAVRGVRWLIRWAQHVKYDGIDGGSSKPASTCKCIDPMRLHAAASCAACAAIRRCLRCGDAGLVSFSSSIIAAVRALETSKPDAYIRDPLAAALAGPAAMRRIQVGPRPASLRHPPTSANVHPL